MNRFFPLLFIIVIFLLGGCLNKKDKDHQPDPEAIWLDYQVSGKEGDDNLTLLLLYRDGDEEGDGMAIGEPGKVMVDGEIVPADSTRMNGYFYELHKPLANFAGPHAIVFTNTNGKEYREEFSFQPITLISSIGDTVLRNELVLEFEGLEPDEHIRLLLTDTSFINDGINRMEKIEDGRLVISREDLETIGTGPVQLELIREYERPVKKGAGAGGRLQITYSLKREFFLKD